MMHKVLYMKRRTKGAISVFLILIFLANYVLAALLVDGGRYRMAQVSAEAALDSANQSVLSYYNQMLYDLYGIFAVDTENVTEEEIAEVLETYINRTLAVADIDYDGYSTGLTNWLLEGNWQPGEGVDYFNDYDFEVSLTAGSSVTLASTDYVEDQIVDYMKYRAPVELAVGEDGFLNKLNGVVGIKDRLVATKDQISITNSHKDLFKKSDSLLNDINDFNKKMIAFCNNPCIEQAFREDMLASGKTKDDYAYGNYNKENAAELYDLFGKPFDSRLEEIGNYKAEEVSSVDENGQPRTAAEIADLEAKAKKELRERQEKDYKKAKEDFLNSLDPMFANAESFYNKANELRDEITEVNNAYNKYIAELQAELDKHKDNPQYQTVYAPEIAMAKSNCGEILKNVDLILSSRQFTYDLVKLGEGSNWSAFETAVGGIIDHRLNGGSPTTLKIALDAGESGNWAGETACQYFADAQADLYALMSQTSYFYKCHKAEVDVVVGGETPVNGTPTPTTDKKEEVKIVPENLKEEDLAVNYTHAVGENSSGAFGLGGNVKTDDATNILNAGLSLIEMLEDALEGVRDSVYVNEYIMTTFPNVVTVKKESDDLTALQAKRKEYRPTVAGAEYILIGSTNSNANVIAVDAELLGVRTIFNTTAIFTDTAKRHQASTLAATISGPYAPLVTIVLLLAWAVAESAIDVIMLKNGEEVLLFKSGKDWELSVEGAVENLIDVAVDTVKGMAGDLISSLHSQLENAADEVIYEVYNNAVNGVDSAVNEAKKKVQDLSDQISGDSAECKAALSSVTGEFNASADELKGQFEEWLGEPKEKAIKVINESMDTAFDKVSDEVETNLNGLSDEVKDRIKGKIPVGEVVDSGSSEGLGIKLNYQDYLRIFLLMMNQDTKVQRVQSLIQASMIHGGNENFRMESSAVAVWADMDCSIRYLFMTNAILPEDLKREGRMTFTVHGAASY